MNRFVQRAANWFAPVVCPGCEEGSGLVRDCATGRFERCGICQRGSAREEHRTSAHPITLERHAGAQSERDRHAP